MSKKVYVKSLENTKKQIYKPNYNQEIAYYLGDWYTDDYGKDTYSNIYYKSMRGNNLIIHKEDISLTPIDHEDKYPKWFNEYVRSGTESKVFETRSFYNLWNVKYNQDYYANCFESFIPHLQNFTVCNGPPTHFYDHITIALIPEDVVKDYINLCIDTKFLPEYININKIFKAREHSNDKLCFLIKINSRKLDLELFYLYHCMLRNIYNHPTYVNNVVRLYRSDIKFEDNINLFLVAYLSTINLTLSWSHFPFRYWECNEEMINDYLKIYHFLNHKRKIKQMRTGFGVNGGNRWWRLWKTWDSFDVPTNDKGEIISDKYNLYNINELSYEKEINGGK